MISDKHVHIIDIVWYKIQSNLNNFRDEKPPKCQYIFKFHVIFQACFARTGAQVHAAHAYLCGVAKNIEIIFIPCEYQSTENYSICKVVYKFLIEWSPIIRLYNMFSSRIEMYVQCNC